MISDYLKLGIRNIKKRRLRSWLTMFGIFLSVATIFILISLSLGLEGAIQEQFNQLGADKFFIMPAGQLGPPGSSAVGAILTEKDLEVIEKVSGVKETLPIVMGNAKVEFSGQSRYFQVVGLPVEKADFMVETGIYKVSEGRFLQPGDSGKVIVGYQLRYESLFKKPVIVGEKVIINGGEYRVKATLQSTGNPSDDKYLIISLEDFKELFKSGERLDQIVVQADSADNLKSIVESVEKDLRKSRNVEEKNQDFIVSTPEELLGSFKDVLNIVTAFLIGIAAISLFVGGVGIANTMYTSVLERRKEIGTMKAVGAKNSDIVKLFVIESGLLGLMGGVVGVILGIVVGKVIEFIAIHQLNTTLLRAATPAYLIFGCLVFAFIIGAVSGMLPAMQASKLKPVDALRYE